MLSLLLLALATPLALLPGVGAVVVLRARGEPARGRTAQLGVAILVVGEAMLGCAWMASLIGLTSALLGMAVVLALLIPVGNVVLAYAGSTEERPLVGVYLLGLVVLFAVSMAGYSLAYELQNLASVGLAIAVSLAATAWAVGGGGALAFASALALPRKDPGSSFGAPPSRWP